ncbi:MAG: formate/nitrite transporter family protein [Rhodospirillales bacterium]|nr:formate/nitrite transporter family protein [Rhodospirillales bacterium]MCW8861278.1 formate/nitrite transporter family protein [Rhodospirillales bacterium]MCW9001902.1 formate/nitrite transporter family protein [Rhodospirillales bacterium]
MLQRNEEAMTNGFNMDAYAPREIAQRVENAGIGKATMPLTPLFTLGVLAGAFIALGAMFYTVAVTGSELGYGPTRVLGGLVFSLGLVLVVIAGAELFTGNNLIIMAWADGKITMAQLLRNWVIVFAGNFVGSVATAAIMYLSGALDIGGGNTAKTAIAIAEGKIALPFAEAFFRGVLCNALVCLAVWLTFAAHSVVDKIFAILFPITAFVALGFEHSVANMYLIPIGMLAAGSGDVAGFIGNLIPVTLGNIVGGGVFVALVYHLIYVRKWD